MASDSILVFDVGGTQLRAAVYDPSGGRLVRVARSGTPGFHERPAADGETIRRALYDEMQIMARELFPDTPPRSIAVAFAGPLDPHGRALAAPTIWGDRDSGRPVPLAEELKARWPGSRVLLLNDVSAAGYRYLDRPDEDLCIVTVSSGIGHKLFVAGRVVVGPGGRGGELGHLRVDFSSDAPRCDCGGRGHLGSVSSGSAAAEQIRRLAGEDADGFAASAPGRLSGKRTERIDNAMLVAAFREGDAWARRVIQRMARPLGHVLASVHLAVGVERFVIVGGFALALGEGYRKLLCAAAQDGCWDVGADWERMIELGHNDDDAGLIGAGRFAAKYG